MKTEAWFQDLVDEFKDDADFRTETAILDFTEKMIRTMKDRHISRADLARRLGVSKAFITKLLNGNANLTIKTMVAIAGAIGCELNFDICPNGFTVARIFYVSSTPDIDMRGYRKVASGFSGEKSDVCAA